MQSFTFKPGLALFLSQSLNGRWAVVFEDEGPAGYCYACDRQLGEDEEGVVDAMLIYNGASLEDRERERIASVQWSPDGDRAVLYLDGTPQAYMDFVTRESSCRMDFPNFLEANDNRQWRRSTHAWNEELVKRFEAALYVN
ncbi:DUF2251 domain-containing protein [Granulicella cerasi]|uniref:DUF2251 domain-containing protein n=1 Tax=Granulicella cerasi TaxID=741063 RepID=A0ABW1ZAF1_9BACT|nr:DUF2251 domain-containing protein [Granulicella cerasi]